jgi:hypothetical protein
MVNAARYVVRRFVTIAPALPKDIKEFPVIEKDDRIPDPRYQGRIQTSLHHILISLSCFQWVVYSTRAGAKASGNVNAIVHLALRAKAGSKPSFKLLLQSLPSAFLQPLS